MELHEKVVYRTTRWLKEGGNARYDIFTFYIFIHCTTYTLFTNPF